MNLFLPPNPPAQMQADRADTGEAIAGEAAVSLPGTEQDLTRQPCSGAAWNQRGGLPPPRGKDQG